MKQKLNNILFNGYVREPIPMVILAAIVGIALLLFAIWASIDLFITSSYDSITREAQFVKFERDGPIYSLLSSDGYSFDLPAASISDISLIDWLIDNEVSLLVEYASPPAEDNSSLDILSVSMLDGSSIISSCNISEARTIDAWISAAIMWAVCLIYWLFISASYYFISNAPRYSRIASFLVRESFRNF